MAKPRRRRVLRYKRNVVVHVLKRLLAESGSAFGSELELAAALGAKMGWQFRGRPMKAEMATQRALGWLNDANVIEEMRNWFEDEAGFSPAEAAQTLVGHIRQTEDRMASLQGLRMYYDRTLPKPTKRVDVKQESVVARITVHNEVPPIAVRSIETIDVTPVSPETSDAD